MSLISRLRSSLKLTEDQASDEQILKCSEGTLFRSSIEINMAVENFFKSLRDIVRTP